MAKTATNITTKACIDYLYLIGYKVWRNNNGAVYSVQRKSFLKNPNHLLGVPDIVGFSRINGRAIFVEIKTGKDKLSPAQARFIAEAKDSGCIALVVKDSSDLIEQMAKVNASDNVG